MNIAVSNFRSCRKNTLLGFFDLEFDETGMVLRGCGLHERDGEHWIGWPAKPYTKEDGTPSWSAIVDFRNANSKRLMQAAVLPHAISAFANEGGV